ncbi:MAG: GTP cyclohydrolase II, partial [Planctomycetes bacterium]|nr:GTP cyclohydrolase II [Planctomycetota bacterium]
ITTGISAFDRALTVRKLADPTTRIDDLRRPGHVFPLRARPGGVLERAGHTEASIDLARLAGCTPASVICEVMNDDGTMARRPQLEELAEREGLLIGSIEDLIAYRREHDPAPAHSGVTGVVRHRAVAKLPTPFGQFAIHVFANERDEELVALCLGDLRADDRTPLARVHSACFTGDVLGSLRCDCGGQLHMALRAMGEAGHGVLIYLPQEGRGIGLARKIEAYQLQEFGLDTVEANEKLGYPADLRSYEDAAAVLGWFGVRRVRLMTNNPAKIQGLSECGIEVVERIAIEPGPGPVNHGYLKTKKGKMGHFFEAV